MTIIADENIARADEAFAQFGTVRTAAGRAITRELLTEADALIVRSITQVDRELLHGTPVRFVGTATIGTDHIDLDYLFHHGIGFADAAGGGARSVAEYIVAALLTLRERGMLRITGERLGVIGVGAIGSRASAFAHLLGMDVVEYDPPRAAAEPNFISAPLEKIFECDVIVPALPLSYEGEHPTHHLIDHSFLARMKPGAVLINTARGGVADSAALIQGLKEGQLGNAVLDVWEGEPDVPIELLERCLLTTPHIAGYSQDGKLKGTEMMAEGLAKHCGVENLWHVAKVLPSEAGRVDVTGLTPLDAARKTVLAAYDIEADSSALRRTFTHSSEERRKEFDLLRKNYSVRREFPAWHFITDKAEITNLLEGIGFTAVNDR